MPDHGRRALHRVCDSVSGVNWRPTRFVDELMLARYACCVCHVIPTTTVVLPCCHALCEECQAGCVVEDGGSVCPLDGEPFTGDECDTGHLPAKKKHSMKAHCWNEVHGCDFVGPLAAVLGHFEAECTFHSFPCQRCGEDVPKTKLAAHYIGGCRSALSSAVQAKSSQQGGAVVTAGDVSAAGREVEKPVRYTCDDELTVLQSQMNELAEAARMQNATLAASLEALNANVALAAEKFSDVIGEHSQMQQRLLAWKAGESCPAREGGATDTASSSDGSTRTHQMTNALRNLEHLATESLRCLQSLLQITKKEHDISLVLLPPKIDDPTEGCVDSCSSNRVKVNEVVYHALISCILHYPSSCTTAPWCHRRDVWFSVAFNVMERTFKEGSRNVIKITWIGKQQNNSKFPEVVRVSQLCREGSVDLRKTESCNEKWEQLYLLGNWYTGSIRGYYIFEIAIRD